MFSVYPMTYTLSNVFPSKLKVSHNIRELTQNAKRYEGYILLNYTRVQVLVFRVFCEEECNINFELKGKIKA